MNPSAKEFVPAHVLKKRQEESERLNDLTQQLDKVNLDSNQEAKNEKKSDPEEENSASATTKTMSNNKEVQDKPNLQHSTPASNNNDSERLDTGDHNNQHTSNSTLNNQQQQLQNNQDDETHSKCYVNSNSNNKCTGQTYPEENSDLTDPNVDDRFLLNAGEDICEFNGEQFIIPGDDEYVPATRAGYDFGNAEDNEDEDVCNAFEEFLENLPDQ